MATGRRARAGFATATVLGLLAVVGLLSAGALHDALFGEQLAGSRLLHQRAMALADFGTADGLARISGMPAPESRSYALRPLPSSTDSVEVALRHVGPGPIPDGFSAGRFVLHRFEIESTGHTARGIRAVQVQGAVRMMPDVPPPGARPTP
jgi:hypothetical protein